MLVFVDGINMIERFLVRMLEKTTRMNERFLVRMLEKQYYDE